MGSTVAFNTSSVTIGAVVRTSSGTQTIQSIRLTIEAGTYLAAVTPTDGNNTPNYIGTYRVVVVIPAGNSTFPSVTSRVGLEFQVRILPGNSYIYVSNSFTMAVNGCPTCSATSPVVGSGGTTWAGVSSGVQNYLISLPANAITINGVSYTGQPTIHQSAVRVVDSDAFRATTGRSSL